MVALRLKSYSHNFENLIPKLKNCKVFYRKKSKQPFNNPSSSEVNKLIAIFTGYESHNSKYALAAPQSEEIALQAEPLLKVLEQVKAHDLSRELYIISKNYNNQFGFYLNNTLIKVLAKYNYALNFKCRWRKAAVPLRAEKFRICLRILAETDFKEQIPALDGYAVTYRAKDEEIIRTKQDGAVIKTGRKMENSLLLIDDIYSCMVMDEETNHIIINKITALIKTLAVIKAEGLWHEFYMGCGNVYSRQLNLFFNTELIKILAAYNYDLSMYCLKQL
ncbi:MAG: hypothetical protein FWE37_04480 [Spirochaetaceae bacterium]|nr:hypothetical protein [Spirochaetaceae bacterium]